MTNEELAKVIEAIYDKYEKGEASLLIIKLVQAVNKPAPYYIPDTNPQITPVIQPYDPITKPYLTWTTTTYTLKSKETGEKYATSSRCYILT